MNHYTLQFDLSFEWLYCSKVKTEQVTGDQEVTCSILRDSVSPLSINPLHTKTTMFNLFWLSSKNLFVKERVFLGCWGCNGLKINWNLRSIQLKYFILFHFISVHLISLQFIYFYSIFITILFQFHFNFISMPFQFCFNFILFFSCFILLITLLFCTFRFCTLLYLI